MSALFIIEALPGRGIVESERPSAESNWTVCGTSDIEVAKALVKATTPATVVSATVGTLYRMEMSAKESGFETWDCSVKYGPRKPPEPGDFSVSFDMGGGTQHITQALAHVASYAPTAETAPDFHGAIGDDGDGNVAGCDIIVPQPVLTEMWQMDAATVDAAYRLGLYGCVGKTNQATFRGAAIGEVLMLGASGSISYKNPSVWEITFKFGFSFNKTGVTIGDITSIAKKGWDYLWVSYKTVCDGTPLRKICNPASVHVEQVYDTADFSVLGIGA